VFYEAIGMLVEHAGETLTARHADGREKDVRDQREFRQITTLLKRVGAMWPHVFTSLEAELDVLERTLDGAVAALPELSGQVSGGADRSEDPLQRYRQVLADLDVVVVTLHDRAGDPTAATVVRAVRRGLAEAAEIQGRLVDLALAV
jgi:hypothetical protein